MTRQQDEWGYNDTFIINQAYVCRAPLDWEHDGLVKKFRVYEMLFHVDTILLQISKFICCI